MGTMTRSISTRSVTRRAASTSFSKPLTLDGSCRTASCQQSGSLPPAMEDMQVEELCDRACLPTGLQTSPTSSNAGGTVGRASETPSPENSGSLGNTTALLDMDTSIMSASGQESLSNLDSLLSKMSLPTRRTSGVFGAARRTSYAPMRLLDERAEIEQDLLADHLARVPRVTGQLLHAPRRVPGYLASTASSTAKRSFGPEDHPAAAGQPSIREAIGPVGIGSKGALGAPVRLRKSSTGLPVPRRGSLLPLATSSNAAKTALNTSTTLSGSAFGPQSSYANPGIVIEGTSGESAVPIGQGSSVPIGATPMQVESALRDVVAFVDVKTSEGDEAGGVFADILRSLGARILARATDNVTHIIFKGGRSTTLHRYRAYEVDRRPHLVGVGWIVRCKEKNERVPEEPFLINPDTIDGLLLGSSGSLATKVNRRKTLEPKMLLAPPQAQAQYGTSFSSNIGAMLIRESIRHG